MNFTESTQLRKRAEKVIPDGTMTASKAPRRFVQGVSPCYIAWGDGAEVVDVDGNKFIDTAMALGAVILGYADDDVNKAVQRQVDRGSLFTLPGKLEVEVAEELLEHWLPGMDMVRFLKTGSEATSAAVRLARAVTGREGIIAMEGHYHGWHDWTISRVYPARGVPNTVLDDVDQVVYGDLDNLRKSFKDASEIYDADVAAVIMEPTGLEHPPNGYLRAVRELCDEYGALLIFDEVLTGIRFSPTAYANFGVIPDIVTIGKAMGNGYPIAALAGKREYMERLTQDKDGVFISGTYNGELVSLAATKATLEKVRNIRTQGTGYMGLGLDGAQWQRIITGSIQPLKEYGVRVKGYPLHFTIDFDKQSMADLFQQECMRNGVLYTGNHNISFSHTPGIRLVVVEVYNNAAMVVKKAMEEGGEERCRELLEGEPTKKGFRRQG